MAGNDNLDENRRVAEALSRRDVMVGAVLASTTGLAGCGGSGDGDGGGGATTTQQDGSGGSGTTTQDAQIKQKVKNGEDISDITPADPVMNVPQPSSFNPKEANFNWFSESSMKGYYGIWNQALFTTTKAWSHFTDKIPWVGAKEVNVLNDGCTKEVKLIDGLKWWDGTKITGKGLKAQHDIQMHKDWGPNPGDKPNRQLELVDDTTYRWHYKTPQNSFKLRHEASDQFRFHPSWYEPWAQKYRDATTQSEVDTITKNLGSETINMQQLADGLGSGLWKPSDWTGIEMTWEKWDDHPLSGITNLEKMVVRMVPDQTKRIEKAKQGAFDIAHFTDIGVLKPQQVPNFELVHEFTFNSTIDLHMNMEGNHVGNRHVRRAMAYALDFKELAATLTANGITASPMKWMTGISRKPNRRWLGKEWLNQTIDYGVTAKLDEAEKAMQKGGYSKEGDVWVGPDGNRTKGIKFINIAGQKKLETMGQYVASKLSDFGLKIDQVFESGSNWNKDMKASNFDISIHWEWSGPARGWGPRSYVRPYGGSGLDHFVAATPEDFSKPKPKGGCQKMEFEPPPLAEEKGPWFNHPVRPEYPAKPGVKEIDSGTETQTLYPIKWLWEGQQTTEESKAEELTKKWATWNQYSLPRIPGYNEYAMIVGDTKNFTWLDVGELPERRDGLSENHRPIPHPALGATVGTPK